MTISKKSKTTAHGGTEKPETVNYFPFVTLAIFTIFMLTLPLATYYLIARIVPDSTVFAAMGAIVAVQIIIGGYIFIAWREENRDYALNKKTK